MTKKKNNLVDLLELAKSARAAMGEKKWAIYVKEQQEIAAQSLIQTKREFDEFMNSPEPAARDALELGLNELKTNAVIQKSETCIEALDALIWCIKHNWWAKDSEALLKPIAHEFQTINCREISTNPRPGGKSAFREAILEVMKHGKSSGQEFKTFMQMWRLGNINGLTIKAIESGDCYIITDEDGDLGNKSYEWGTLVKMYSEK